jgi:hypothetical protein
MNLSQNTKDVNYSKWLLFTPGDVGTKSKLTDFHFTSTPQQLVEIKKEIRGKTSIFISVVWARPVPQPHLLPAFQMVPGQTLQTI